jgi:ATP-dependent helicase/nuclease subunit B
MALTFLIGRAGYGKTSYILEHLLTEKRKKYILVPEQVDFEYEKKLIRMIPDTIRKNVEVITFTALARKIFYETGGVLAEPLNNAGKAMIIYKIMREERDRLKVLNTGRLSRGLVNLVSAQISGIKNSLVSPDDLAMLSEKMTGSSGLCGKIQDLAVIYGRYQEYLKEKYYDGEDELDHVVKKIPGSLLFKDSVIYFDSFRSFSRLELKVTEALMINGNDIYFSLTADPYELDGGHPVWSAVSGTIKRIREIARSNGIYINKDILLLKRNIKCSDAISHIEKELFRTPASLLISRTGGFTMAKYQNLYSEAEGAAIEIRRLTRVGKMRYRDISVAVPDIMQYGPVLSEIFDMYGIPYYIDEKLKFTEHPLARYFIDLFDSFSNGYQYESMINILKSDYTDLEPSEMDLLENHILSKGIKGLKWYDASRFEDEGVHGIWERFITPVYDLYLDLKKDMKAKHVAESIFKYISEIGLPERLAYIGSGYSGENRHIQASRLNQAYTMLIRVLGDIYDIFSSDRLSLDDVCEILTCAFSEYSLATIPFGMDEIHIGSIGRQGREDISALFILGAYDGAFSAGRKENTIFTDSELARIIESGFDRVPDPHDIIPDNENLMYMTLTRPSRILSISCPMSDMTGKMTAASDIFDRLDMLFKDLDIYREPAVTLRKRFQMDSEYTQRTVLKDVSVELRKKKAGLEIDDLYMGLYEYLRLSDEKTVFDIVNKGLNYSNYVDKIDEGSIREIFGTSFHSSVSRLQKFRQCPFSFFMEYGLNAKERKVRDFTKADAGTFIHAVLERFQKEAFRDRGSISKDNLKGMLADAIDSVLNDSNSWMLKEDGIFAGIKKDLIGKLETTCRIIYENTVNSSFRPLMFEAEFKENGEYPPIILKTDSGDMITIDGKIDRIDVFAEGENVYFAVFDYKTGNKVFSLSDIYHGLDLQLLVYLDALLKGNAEAKTAGAFYFHVKDPVIKADPDVAQEDIDREIKKQYRLSGLAINDPEILDSLDRFEKNRGYYQTLPVQIKENGFSRSSKVASYEQFFCLFGFVERKLVELSEGIKSGKFPVKPIKYVNMTACKFCDYQKICLFDESIKQNKYDVLSNVGDEEFWNMTGAGKDGK